MMKGLLDHKYLLLSMILLGLVFLNAYGLTGWVVETVSEQAIDIPAKVQAAEPECYEADNSGGTNPDCLDCQICDGPKGEGECVDNCSSVNKTCVDEAGGECKPTCEKTGCGVNENSCCAASLFGYCITEGLKAECECSLTYRCDGGGTETCSAQSTVCKWDVSASVKEQMETLCGSTNKCSPPCPC